MSKTVNKANADHAVLFEAVNLILAQGSAAQPKLKSQVPSPLVTTPPLPFLCPQVLLLSMSTVFFHPPSYPPLLCVPQALNLLGKFISVKEPNIRYLGLEALGRFAQTDISDDSIKKHMGTVMISLRDADVRYARHLKRH